MTDAVSAVTGGNVAAMKRRAAFAAATVSCRGIIMPEDAGCEKGEERGETAGEVDTMVSTQIVSTF